MTQVNVILTFPKILNNIKLNIIKNILSTLIAYGNCQKINFNFNHNATSSHNNL